MTTVETAPGSTQQELVGLTHIDPSTMVQTLDFLSEAGFAERRPHPTDRRKHTVHLTKKGERALAQAREAAQDAAGETFRRLDADERRELHRLLAKAAGLEEEK
jgi:DNA-binding MarR family transcriptional regulator